MAERLSSDKPTDRELNPDRRRGERATNPLGHIGYSLSLIQRLKLNRFVPTVWTPPCNYHGRQVPMLLNGKLAQYTCRLIYKTSTIIALILAYLGLHV